MTDTFLNRKELTLSIIQGLVITLGVLFAYQLTVINGANEEKTRAMVFTTLIFSNILLSFANRSFYFSMIESFQNKNLLLIGITIITLFLLFTILYFAPFSNFFGVSELSTSEIGYALLIASVSVLWFELYKLAKRTKKVKVQKRKEFALLY